MQNTKTAKCEICCPEGGAIHEATYGTNDGGETVPLWECRNCGHVTRRRTPKRREGLTRSQQRAIETIKTFWEEYRVYSWGTSRTECTRCDVEPMGTGAALIVANWTTTVVNTHGTHTSVRRGVFRIGRTGRISSGDLKGTQALIHGTR